MAIARAGQAYGPLGWLESEELSPSLSVEGSLDHADVEGGIFEDWRPFPLAGEPLHGSAFVSAQGSVFGNVTRKDDLGVSSPGFLPWVGNSPQLDDSSGGVVEFCLHPRVSALGSEPESQTHPGAWRVSPPLDSNRLRHTSSLLLAAP